MKQLRHFKKGILAGLLLALSASASGQLVTTIAGISDGSIPFGFRGDGIRATQAQLWAPYDLTLRPNGDLYFTDGFNHRIRKIDAKGIITTIAGTGTSGYSGDNGPALSATLNTPQGITADAAGNIYFTDSRGLYIRRIDAATGIITTIAGNGTAAFSGDNGPATAASLNQASDVIIGPAGSLYITDNRNHRIRKIDASGMITTIAGNGTAAFAGDNGPALSASFNNPAGLLLDASGNLYVGDLSNRRIRKIDASGTVTTVAGNGSTTIANGPALSVGLKAVNELALAPNGTLYFAELNTGTAFGGNVRGLANGNVYGVLAGASFGGQGHGGPAAAAALNSVRGIVSDANSNLYLADPDDNRIVMYCNNPVLPADSAYYVKPAERDNAANPFTAMERCKVICMLGTAAGQLSGEVQYRVKVAGATPVSNGQPFVKRYYDIQPLQTPNAAGTLTLYFTQAEFDAYNTSAGNSYKHLPANATDAAGIANMMVMHYNGTGTAPGNYTGSTISIDPVDAAVVYNPVYTRWEVSFETQGMGGFYLTSRKELAVTGLTAAEVTLRAFPTASAGKVMIEAAGLKPGGMPAQLLDMAGRAVRRLQLTNSRQELDITGLAPGTYTLQVPSGNTCRIIRL